MPSVPARVQRRLERLRCLDLVALLAPLGRPQGLQLLVDAPERGGLVGGIRSTGIYIKAWSLSLSYHQQPCAYLDSRPSDPSASRHVGP
jgi:hypothetical protein